MKLYGIPTTLLILSVVLIAEHIAFAKPSKTKVHASHPASKEAQSYRYSSKESRAASKEAKSAEREARKLEREAKKASRKAAKEQKKLLKKYKYLPVDDPQCLNAVSQCSLFDVVESEMKPAWERTMLKKEIKAVYKQRKNQLKHLKKYVIQLIDLAIRNPDMDQLVPRLCEGVQGDQGSTGGGPNPGGNNPFSPVDPKGNGPLPGDPWTQPPAIVDPWIQPGECIVTQWSEWSAPFGFGKQDRKRDIIQAGVDCPYLREERNISSPTSE